MGKFTSKTIVELKGNPKKPEPAQHLIKFPGGAIELSRTEDNEYWAHIIVNHNEAGNDIGGERERAHGVIVDSRVDMDHPLTDILKIPGHEMVNHIAVRIRTKMPDGGLVTVYTPETGRVVIDEVAAEKSKAGHLLDGKEWRQMPEATP